jgi:hypothetical protein
VTGGADVPGFGAGAGLDGLRGRCDVDEGATLAPLRPSVVEALAAGVSTCAVGGGIGEPLAPGVAGSVGSLPAVCVAGGIEAGEGDGGDAADRCHRPMATTSATAAPRSAAAMTGASLPRRPAGTAPEETGSAVVVAADSLPTP